MCVYICVIFCIYILFCNRAPWKNSLTERSALYKYIGNKNSEYLALKGKMLAGCCVYFRNKNSHN